MGAEKILRVFANLFLYQIDIVNYFFIFTFLIVVFFCCTHSFFNLISACFNYPKFSFLYLNLLEFYYY